MSTASTKAKVSAAKVLLTTLFIFFASHANGQQFLFSPTRKMMYPPALEKTSGRLACDASLNTTSCNDFRSPRSGKKITESSSLSFFKVLLALRICSCMGCFMHMLSSNTSKLQSGLVCDPSQLSCPTKLRRLSASALLRMFGALDFPL